MRRQDATYYAGGKEIYLLLLRPLISKCEARGRLLKLKGFVEEEVRVIPHGFMVRLVGEHVK